MGMRSEKLQVADFEIVSSLYWDEWPEGCRVINAINAYSWAIAQSNEEFKTALRASDVLIPDGVGAVIATRLLTGVKIKKMAGMDLHRMLLEFLEKRRGRCFYLGASRDTLEKIAARVAVEYSSVAVAFYDPPYKDEFSDEDNAVIYEKINAFAPDVVFVGMTAPKQEVWIYRNHRHMDVSVICGIGAVFDFYSGTIKRPSQWMIDHNLEWFGRFLSDPGRLWKRYLVYNVVFIYQIVRRFFASYPRGRHP